jgi:hypothetical protein
VVAKDKAPSTLNPLAVRDRELLRQLNLFRGKLADVLLEVFQSLLDDPRCRLGNQLEPLEGIHAAAQVVRVLTKDAWTEEDLNVFEAHWQAAIRSPLFGGEFEADRHRLQLLAKTAREQLIEAEKGVKQPTLW